MGTPISDIRSDALFGIVLGLENRGKLDKAWEIAQLLNGSSRSIVWESIAVEFAKVGQFERALDIARNTASESDNMEIAIEFAKVGQFEKALDIARNTVDEFDDSQIAIELFRIGKYDQALGIAQSVEDGSYRENIFTSFAKTLTSSGQVEKALQLTQQVHPSEKDWILGGVAQELVLVDFYHGLRIFRTLSGQESQRTLAHKMAANLTQGGQLEKALKLAEIASQEL